MQAHLFVYGTLRPGFKLYPSIAPAVLDTAPAVMPGLRLHHVDSGRAVCFPVAVEDPDAAIVGTLLTVNPRHIMYALIVRMELMAGYSLKEKPWRSLPSGQSGKALVFTWTHSDYGWHVIGNDWANVGHLNHRPDWWA